MKTTRHYAINTLFAKLGQMALGHLDENTLEVVMTNFEALRKVADDFESLKKELFKRIYGDSEKMTEEEKKRINDFFSMLGKIKGENVETVKVAYPDLYAMREKEVKVIVSLLNKEIEVDITPMNENAFVKGVLKGNKTMNTREVSATFAPMFEVAESEDEADYSELDELLND